MPVPTSAQYRKKTLREVALGIGDGTVPSAGTNEVQSVTLTSATGGTFTLSYGGQTTAAIAYNASAAAVQAALEALSTIGAGNVAVTGAAGGPYTVTFQSALGATDVAQMTASGALLTGAGAAIAVATTTPGVAAVTGIAYIPLNAAGVTPNPETVDLITQLTTQRLRDREITAYGITIDQQAMEDAILQLAHALTTTGLPAGVAKRYHGSGVLGTTPVEIRLKYTMVKISDRSVRTEYWRFLKCSMNAADPPASPAEQVVASQHTWFAEKTTVDVAGATVAGVPTDGDFFVVDILS